MFRTKDLVDGCAGAGERRRVIPDCGHRGWWGTHRDKEACAQHTVSSSAERGIMCDKILSPDTLNVDMGDFV